MLFDVDEKEWLLSYCHAQRAEEATVEVKEFSAIWLRRFVAGAVCEFEREGESYNYSIFRDSLLHDKILDSVDSFDKETVRLIVDSSLLFAESQRSAGRADGAMVLLWLVGQKLVSIAHVIRFLNLEQDWTVIGEVLALLKALKLNACKDGVHAHYRSLKSRLESGDWNSIALNPEFRDCIKQAFKKNPLYNTEAEYGDLLTPCGGTPMTSA